MSIILNIPKSVIDAGTGTIFPGFTGTFLTPGGQTVYVDNDTDGADWVLVMASDGYYPFADLPSSTATPDKASWVDLASSNLLWGDIKITVEHPNGNTISLIGNPPGWDLDKITNRDSSTDLIDSSGYTWSIGEISNCAINTRDDNFLRLANGDIQGRVVLTSNALNGMVWGLDNQVMCDQDVASIAPHEHVEDANTITLIHSNGPNGSTSIIDSTTPAETWTAAGNINHSIINPIVGSTSLYFNNNVANYIWSPIGPEYNFGNEFTIDFWAYFNHGGVQKICGAYDQTDSTNNAWTLYYDGAGNLKVDVRVGGSNIMSLTAPWAAPVGSWFHIAFVRSASNTWHLFIDGVELSTSGGAAITWPSYDWRLEFGRGFASGLSAFHGYLDEIRISDIARWTSNFNPNNYWYPDAAIRVWRKATGSFVPAFDTYMVPSTNKSGIASIANAANRTIEIGRDGKFGPTTPITTGQWYWEHFHLSGNNCITSGIDTLANILVSNVQGLVWHDGYASAPNTGWGVWVDADAGLLKMWNIVDGSTKSLVLNTSYTPQTILPLFAIVGNCSGNGIYQVNLSASEFVNPPADPYTPYGDIP